MLRCTAGDALRPTRGSLHLSIMSTSLCRLRLIDTAPARTNVELGESVRLPRGAPVVRLVHLSSARLEIISREAL
jgi:hypothetical protein